MRKSGLTLIAAALAVFGFGVVASAQGYGESVSTSPGTPSAGDPYSITYSNCVVGDTITFTQAESTPTSVTATCEAPGSGSALNGSATGNFTAAPGSPGTFSGVAVGSQSPQVGFQFTVPGQAAPTTAAPAVPGGGLPATGTGGLDTTTAIALGLLVVGLGLFAVTQVRRRQDRAAA